LKVWISNGAIKIAIRDHAGICRRRKCGNSRPRPLKLE
jgi:hypothetical protein